MAAPARSNSTWLLFFIMSPDDVGFDKEFVGTEMESG
jgi:hypothetical protein